MKKTGFNLLVFVFVLMMMGTFLNPSMSVAATDSDLITPVQMGVLATIAINCDASVTMNAITGTGQSTIDANNRALCNVQTNNSAGYKLEWQASSATMISGDDTIAAYTPAVADTPETWSIGATTSEWGAHVGSGSTTVNTTTWGAADTYAGGKWLNVGTSAFQIASRSDETTWAGDDEYVYFGAQVGSTKLQPTGTYAVNVTVTATTL